jgi:multiple sugar transport system substrate-binding protein
MSSRRTQRLRTLGAGILVASLIPALAACSTPADGGSTDVEGSTITLQTLSVLAPQFEEYAAAYMEEYPERTVEIKHDTNDWNQYAQQLATSRISNDLPELFLNVDFLSDTLSNNNVTLDLAPGIAEGKLEGLTLDEFLPQFVGQYRPIANPDQITGLPVSADTVGIFYNKTLFEQYGITEFPSADWEWEDMYRVAEQISVASGGAVLGLQAPLGDGNAPAVFGPVITAGGGFVYDSETNTSGIGQPEALKAWELMLESYGTISGPYSATTDASQSFDVGKVAMAVGARGSVPQVQENMPAEYDWDVQTMPLFNGNSTTGGGSFGISIAQEGKNVDAAWAFLSWFYQTEGGMKIAQEVGGVIPPTQDGIDNGIWKDGTPPPANIAVFGEAARTAVLLAQLPGTAGSVQGEAIKKAVQEVLLQGRSIADAFGEAEATVNAQLELDAPDN